MRTPMIVAFSTARSAAAFLRTGEVLERFGVRPRVTGFIRSRLISEDALCRRTAHQV
ncbi:hypothetical protein ACRAWG_11640 [Methylobacterium sp. P31]